MKNAQIQLQLILNFAAKVKNILRQKFKKNLVSLCLFGSAARNNLRKGSDIDFLVVLEKAQRSYHQRGKEVLPAIDEIRASSEFLRLEILNLELEPSFLVFSKEEIKNHPSLLIEISEDGIILEDKEGFLGQEMVKVREKLACFGAFKKLTPHGHYWVLKPDLKLGEVFEI